MTVKHSVQQPTDGIHGIRCQDVADATARLALTFASTDDSKVVKQLSDSTYWLWMSSSSTWFNLTELGITDVDFGGKEAKNAHDPTAAQSLATKSYVDSHVVGGFSAFFTSATPTVPVGCTYVEGFIRPGAGGAGGGGGGGAGSNGIGGGGGGGRGGGGGGGASSQRFAMQVTAGETLTVTVGAGGAAGISAAALGTGGNGGSGGSSAVSSPSGGLIRSGRRTGAGTWTGGIGGTGGGGATSGSSGAAGAAGSTGASAGVSFGSSTWLDSVAAQNAGTPAGAGGSTAGGNGGNGTGVNGIAGISLIWDSANVGMGSAGTSSGAAGNGTTLGGGGAGSAGGTGGGGDERPMFGESAAGVNDGAATIGAAGGAFGTVTGTAGAAGSAGHAGLNGRGGGGGPGGGGGGAGGTTGGAGGASGAGGKGSDGLVIIFWRA